MTSRRIFRRSHEVKEVIHIRANKFAGYFNPDCKRFAIDPHVTTYDDLREILVNAFNLNGFFNISYLCRDDKGENIYLSLHTEWDLDAAFMTSSDPYLILKVEIESHSIGPSAQESELELDKSTEKSNESFFGFGMATGFQVPKAWSELAGNAIAKITSGIGQNFSVSNEEDSFLPRRPPLGDCELHDYLDEHGRLTKPEDLRMRIYHGGVEPSLRKVAWRLLLNIFPGSLTAEDRVTYMKRKTKEYHSLYTQWKSLRENRFIQDLRKTIWKDVLRTDRSHPYFAGPDDNPHLISLHNLLLTYALTHEKVRYCQGMSDIAAPILVVMNNEPHAYVCFCGLMERLGSNFRSDGEVMSRKFEHLALLLRYYDSDYFEFLKSLGADSMYFCYRWLLLEMKREFNFNDALVVLEVMWSSLPPKAPDSDLPLGTITLNDKLTDSCERGSVPVRKKNSMPDLTLSVKNLPAMLRTGLSSGNLKDMNGSGTGNAFTDHNDIPYYCENLFPVKPNNTMYLTQHNRGYAPLPNVDVYDIDDGIFNGRYSNLSLRQRHNKVVSLPPPEQLGCGNPFLLFICLSVLFDQKEELMNSDPEYADLVMHFDKMVRKHSLEKILSKSMQLFASYLRSQSSMATSS